MVAIKGWEKASLIDFPPYTVSVIFLGGCNFRCSFCHNPDLVINHNNIPDIEQDEILNYLEEKKNWIDGVCITGGEPTLHGNLSSFISKLKGIGMKVKLDTNGTNPNMLQDLIEKDLLDFIAMDIKSSQEGYKEVCRVGIDKDKIKKSISLIKESGIDHEFRTTVVPGLVGNPEIKKIGEWLKGSKRYAIQNFRGNSGLMDKTMEGKDGYSEKELKDMKEIASEYFENVEVRK